MRITKDHPQRLATHVLWEADGAALAVGKFKGRACYVLQREASPERWQCVTGKPTASEAHRVISSYHGEWVPVGVLHRLAELPEVASDAVALAFAGREV